MWLCFLLWALRMYWEDLEVLSINTLINTFFRKLEAFLTKQRRKGFAMEK